MTTGIVRAPLRHDEVKDLLEKRADHACRRIPMAKRYAVLARGRSRQAGQLRPRPSGSALSIKSLGDAEIFTRINFHNLLGKF